MQGLVDVLDRHVLGEIVVVVAVAAVAELADAHDGHLSLQCPAAEMAGQIDRHAAARATRQPERDQHGRRVLGSLHVGRKALQGDVELSVAQVVVDRTDGFGNRPRHVLSLARHLEVLGQAAQQLARPVFLDLRASSVEVTQEVFLVGDGQGDGLVMKTIFRNAPRPQPCLE